jgi:hypothetical protein
MTGTKFRGDNYKNLVGNNKYLCSIHSEPLNAFCQPSVGKP